jgi:flagellar hook-associated protein 2
MVVTASSSLDVNSIVTQLMVLERRPLAALQRREDALNSKLSALGRLQSAMSTLRSAASDLTLNGSFRAAKATSANDSAVGVTVSGTPAQASYNLTVNRLARVQTSASTAFAGGATASIGTGTLTLRDAGGAVIGTPIDFGGSSQPATVQALSDAINRTDGPVRASVVSDASGARLVLTSRDTGAAGSFTVELGGSPAIALQGLAGTPVQTPLDAQLSFNGLTLTSTSNRVSGVIDGLTLELKKADAATPVQIDVAQDAEAIRGKVDAFVKAYNEVDKLIGDLTRFNPDTRSAAVLNGESVVRQADTALRSIVRGVKTGTAGEFTRLADIGISLERDGTMKLDEEKFDAVLAADSGKVQRLFTSAGTGAERGFAIQLRARLDEVTDSDGMLGSRQDGLRSSIRTIDQQQERLEARMDLIEARLRREYSKLDALVSSRQSQLDALTNALSALPR